MTKPAILLVDDEADNVDALERLFRKNYEVFKATSGKQGLDILKKHSVALIISDQRMPQMTGVEFLKESMELHPDAIRILLTGYTDIDSVIGAINSGQVYRYVTKPWDPRDLTNTVDKAVEKYELRATLRQRNEELKQALGELQTLDQSKNQFMVLINHELKTPLTVMISFLDLLKETSLDDEQSKYAARMETSTLKLKKIVDEVLELVSADTSLMALNKKKLASAKLLDGLEDEFAENAKQREQKLVFDIEDVKVLGDKEVLGKALRRLLDNAIKFGDKKSDIKVSVKSEDDEQLRISVTNKGSSLPKKIVEKIMKPFALDEDMMNHTQGLGLGLSLSRALLKHHGTQLEVDSPKGLVTMSFLLEKS